MREFNFYIIHITFDKTGFFPVLLFKSKLHYFFLFLFLLFCPKYVFTQEIISLSEQKEGISISPYLEILEIPFEKKELNIENILKEKYQKQFQKNKQSIPSFGYSPSDFWLKFQIKKENKLDWLLEIEQPFLDYVNFYLIHPDGTILEKRTGGLTPLSTRDLRHHLFLFDMNLEEGKTYTVYIHISGNSVKVFPLKLYPKNNYLEHAHQIDIFLGIYFGFFVSMILYNLFLFWSLRIKSYLYYVFFIAALFGEQFALQGYITLFNPFYYHHIANSSTQLFVPLVILSAFWFTKSFLQLKETLKKSLPILNAFEILAFILLLLGILSISEIIILDILPMLNSYILLVCILILLVIGIIVLLQGYRPARFYMLSWSFLMFGGIIYILRISGVLPINFFTLHALRFGSVLEVLLLSLGLADRFQLAEKEKAEAQANLILALQKNEKLVVEQNQLLEQKVGQRTRELAQKNQDIVSSIYYAQYIQNAMLPLTEDIQKSFPNHFIFYQPRDIISGDFYWHYALENYDIIVVADCTGHGVPGAFMSMLGFSLLNQIVIDKKISQPNLILQKLHSEISKVLNQSKTSNRDGMDMGICLLDKNQSTLHYAGARIPLVYIQGNTIFEIKATSIPLGNLQFYGNQDFEIHQIKFTPETCFYLFSDGYKDQFGGTRGKKYMKSNFKNLLLEIHQKPFLEQKEILSQNLKSWQGNRSQVDDILVMGFKIGYN